MMNPIDFAVVDPERKAVAAILKREANRWRLVRGFEARPTREGVSTFHFTAVRDDAYAQSVFDVIPGKAEETSIFQNIPIGVCEQAEADRMFKSLVTEACAASAVEVMRKSAIADCR